MDRNLCLGSVKGVLDLARLGGFGFGEGDELGLRDELVLFNDWRWGLRWDR